MTQRLVNLSVNLPIMKKFYEVQESAGLPFTCQECGMSHTESECPVCRVIAMTKRTVGELYNIILYVQETSKYETGICSYIYQAFSRNLITERQKEGLIEHLYQNKPTKYSWWWWTTRLDTWDSYWWPVKHQRTRRRFLKHLAKKYKNQHL